MIDAYDVAIIGAGHNGLTCACYLARSGLTTEERTGEIDLQAQLEVCELEVDERCIDANTGIVYQKIKAIGIEGVF